MTTDNSNIGIESIPNMTPAAEQAVDPHALMWKEHADKQLANREIDAKSYAGQRARHHGRARGEERH